MASSAGNVIDQLGDHEETSFVHVEQVTCNPELFCEQGNVHGYQDLFENDDGMSHEHVGDDESLPLRTCGLYGNGNRLPSYEFGFTTFSGP